MRRLVYVMAVLLLSSPAWGADAPAPRVTLAVLDYGGKVPGNPDLGTQMAEILSARLSVEDAFDVVERAKLGKILTEHQLKLSGLVDQENAANVGNLAGAKLLVMGKIFKIDSKLMIVTKIVGTETGVLRGTIREADLKESLSATIAAVADDVAGVVNKDSARLLPKDARLTNPIADLRKALAGKVLPKVVVVIPEEHRTHRVVDPAVETEIKRSLIACGFKVMDSGKNDLAPWAQAMLKNDKEAWPAALTEADYVIVGEAFSEFATRTGALVTCAARAEINIIDRKTGQVVLADRETSRGVDLAEDIAGKTALQKSGRRLALRTIGHFVKSLDKDKKTPKE